jgi:uncharacterized protein
METFGGPPMSWLSDTPDGAVLNLRIIPRAAKNAIQGEYGDALKIRLCAPPVEGAANTALIKFLSKAADVPRSRIQILSGASGRNKRVLLSGCSSSSIQSKLEPSL